jgi:Tfp pilus assembly protein PilX
MAEENTQKPTVVAVPPKKDVVEVEKSVLNDILDQMKSQKEKIANLEEAQKEYEQTATQDQIAKIEKLRASGKLVKAIRINLYENSLVVSWKSTKDDVYIDNTGKEIAVQQTELTFADGKKTEVPQIDFARRKVQKQYEVIQEGRDRDGNMKYTITMEGGKEIELDGRFVN